MTSEEAANKVDTLLKSLGNNLGKFLGTDVGTTATNKTWGVYASQDKMTTNASKRLHFQENLALVKEGCEDLEKALQESAKRALVAPALRQG